ncbi:MAG TPA: alcohol dehydrogenase catalytic domain-containing protein [Acidimicrobiales bacterium]|jgi:threonine dehydrogenase-like Zn-dependent dehydrogenase|nr:alcohol dehydrogenase catalytic domain-containing protein [Acidimicrobiales bacterium]
MKALVFGRSRDASETRDRPGDDLDRRLDTLPFGLHQVDDARLVRPDWVITRPLLSGVCGSETKLVLGDFDTGDIDNPMAAFSSIPHIPGHEVVAEVVALGPEATGLEVGQRVLLNPWLTCGPRGVDPPCAACQRGDLNLCWSFTAGALGPGVHVGVATDAPGGWADLMAAHDSMLIPVPDSITDEEAVLADPFAVSLHAILRCPPPPAGRALVYGAGALGVTSVAILSALYPEVEVAVVARFPAQADLAAKLGAALVLDHEPRLELVEALAEWSGGVLHTAYAGLPMAHPGGIHVVYDTVARPETLEVGVRVLAERGSLVQTGVHTPGRWEYTPIYFKELSIVGSNAFGVEEVEGVRQHALRHYLDLVMTGRVDLTGMLTHRFPLDHWHDALRALSTQEESGAVKVAFEPATSG